MIALIGKTASGKDSIKKELIKLGMDSVVTTTTRPMRKGEVNGVSYHFVSDDEFFKMKDDGLLAESTYYDTVHGRWYYGSQLKDLENHENKVIILNPSGIKEITNKVNMSKWVVFYIYCPEETTRERLKHRGDNPKEVERRLEADNRDFMNIERFVDVNILNDGSKSPEQIAATIKYLYERHIRQRGRE